MLEAQKSGGFKIKAQTDYLGHTKAVLININCHIVLAAPQSLWRIIFFTDSDRVIFYAEHQ
jgi:homogentisate 1,2-dioxygenase